MAGIYIHVPYCKTRCTYCDFFTQTSMSSKDEYVNAICQEAVIRKPYLNNEPINTVYFGGGTPSQLEIEDISKILSTIQQVYDLDQNSEVTLESNPDDLTSSYIAELRKIGVNRLSIGIQTFDDEQLKFLSRRHSSQQALNVVEQAQANGFENISIDLMYGLPNQTLEDWRKNLKIATQLGVQHISAYHLIYEEGTKLFRMLEEGEVRPVDEEVSLQMFSELIMHLKNANFEHYEISNFAKQGYISKHNSSYWLRVPYLGLGPAAHSFNGNDRCWNIASIGSYIKGIKSEKPNIEEEKLDLSAQYNEFILTGMRTTWGIDLTKLSTLFGNKYLEYCLENTTKYFESGDVKKDKDILQLTSQGIFISDSIMSDLMYIKY